jgi:dihydroxyacetone kinase-like protein
MNLLLTALRSAAESVTRSADELNRLDATAGDGDLGVTMTAAAGSVMSVLTELEGKPVADVLRACGAKIATDAPSTSGTLVATGLLAAGRASADDPNARIDALLRAAASAIAARGGAQPGEKTMLDALVPAASAAEAAVGRGQPAQDALRAAAAAAVAGADATAGMAARHGRAGWLAERSAGSEDAGARLIAIALSGACDGVASVPSGT